MTSRRISGGLHDFVDEHNEYGNLSKEEEERFEKAKEAARKRQSTLRYKIRKFLTGKSD